MHVYQFFALLFGAATLCFGISQSEEISSNALNAPSLSSLLVENKFEPLGIDVNPRFSWVISSPVNGDVQKSYRLRLSTSKPGGADIWDSGTILSKIPYLIEYSGPALKSDTHYFWTVDVVTNAGSTSASSQFSTGLLSASDWGTSAWIGKPSPSNGPPDDLVTAFHNSSWIWTPETNPPNAPPGDRVFRKTFAAPTGKIPVSAVILITADDQFSIYVDGQFIGSSPTTTDIWKKAQFFSASLSSNSTLFAVHAINLADVGTGGDGPAGLLLAIKVSFSDGSSTIIFSDSSWLSNKVIPSDWNLPTGNTSGWLSASAIAVYGQGPWTNQVATPTSISSPTLSFADSSWIWSSEASPPNAPAQPRAFRKTFVAASGKTLKSALILLTVDDGFRLYVDGNILGSSPNETDVWKSAQRFTVDLNGTSTLFAIWANNLADVNSGGPSPAGLLGVIQITYTDGSTEVVLSDTTWKVSTDVSNGFELPSVNDSTWSSASSLGKYGVDPWGTGVTISNSLEEHPAPLLRKEFAISKSISFARLYYAAGGYASITINGSPASDRVLSPGFTKYDTELQYVGLDVASKLISGSNAIGIELGRSHYGVTQGNVWNWDSAPWHGEPRVRVVLSIGYTDGTSYRIVSDDSWKVKEGPTRLDDVFGGENFDASYIQNGFDKAGFDSSAWSQAAIMTAPAGALVNQRQPPTRLVQSLTPISITQPVSGIFVAKFERVVAGWVKLTASGPAKTLITIHFGEKLNTDGTVMYQDIGHYYANNFQTDRFWLAGTGKLEVFEPKFSYKGYQYVQIEGWPGSTPPTNADIVGRVVHDDLATRGGFESSSDLLNKMHNAVVFTLLNNVHSIPTDCPTFEKNGWSGDAMLGTEMFLLNLDAQELLAKYVRDLDESRPNGSGPPAVIAPDSGWGANNHAPTWHSAFIFIPWWIYQYRGDRRILEDHYDSMKNYVEFELGRSPNNIADTSLGDWVTPETSPLGGNPPEDTRVSATAYLYRMLIVMQEIATVLNKTSDATTFTGQANSVNTAFNNVFFNHTTGYYTGTGDQGYRQTHNLLALSFGLVPSASIQNVADSIAQDVSSRGTHLNTGALGTKYILPTLSEHGHVDSAFALSQQTTFPSWGFWIENGATTMWEHWALEARSHDHLFLGTFEDWIYKHVVGIQSTAVAFENVTISPLFTSHLTFARTWTLTPFGNLTIDWENNAGNLTVNLGIPVGVNVNVDVPGMGNATAFGSGKHTFTTMINL
ncbi:bacterial alpha-L-rhamnosidase-domain-containing protein [Crucibulum laeve]|uniref:alpha-L-rhamnosidase n=1 Tax=Crucibulum laeve TaxID=68775 RepID=A0A5C3LXS5_9AGAR|nr:bacterial alpha-L-rhamnosidase-domain-containing protein [Crucibulum laeve]